MLLGHWARHMAANRKTTYESNEGGIVMNHPARVVSAEQQPGARQSRFLSDSRVLIFEIRHDAVPKELYQRVACMGRANLNTVPFLAGDLVQIASSSEGTLTIK